MKRFFSFLICLFVFAPCLLFLTSCGEVKTYDIEVRSCDSTYGSVNAIDGTYDEGTSLTLRATPLLDSNFLCWALDGSVISREPEYSITVSQNTQGRYIAIFDKGCQFYVVTKVEYIGENLEQLETKIEVGPTITNTQTVFHSTISPSLSYQTYSDESTGSNFRDVKLVQWDISRLDDYCKVTIVTTPRGDNPTIATHYDDSVSISSLFDNNEKTFEFFKNDAYGIKVTFTKLSRDFINRVF